MLRMPLMRGVTTLKEEYSEKQGAENVLNRLFLTDERCYYFDEAVHCGRKRVCLNASFYERSSWLKQYIKQQRYPVMVWSASLVF